MQSKSSKGIYIHIPFCFSKCIYCSFYSLANLSSRTKKEYITELIKEIKEKDISGSLNEIHTLYIGGGTPSLVEIEDLKAILNAIEEKFNIKVSDLGEVTIEVNPNSTSKEKLKAYRDLGFNRLSIGIQTLNDKLLGILGRAHNKDEALEILKAAEAVGFDNVSVDIIFGLPTQTLEDIANTLETVLEYDLVKHISAYSLIVEEGTPLEEKVNNNTLVLPEENLEREMQYLINDILEKNGFNHYEISNYAKPGYEAKHNSYYWTLDGYYGFGAGASSFINNTRETNIEDIYKYIEEEKIDFRHILGEEEQKGDFMFLGLRRLEGISDAEYRDLFNTSFYDDYEKELTELKKKGLIEEKNSKIKLTSLGLDLANLVFLEFV